MKAISIVQPWAHLILHHGKDIENRTWLTRFRGRIAIHASKYVKSQDIDEAQDVLDQVDPQWNLTRMVNSGEIVTGAIIGTVEIVDCVQKSESPWFFGPFGWVLREPRILAKPIPCKGSLGLWNAPQDIVDELVRRVEAGEFK
jgi:hypothetical protein